MPKTRPTAETHLIEKGDIVTLTVRQTGYITKEQATFLGLRRRDRNINVGQECRVVDHPADPHWYDEAWLFLVILFEVYFLIVFQIRGQTSVFPLLRAAHS